ncbi:MAG TPA: NUDIX domain-containing protein [Anaerolineae bacterium]|nr:NUDIX domain-containing protein [Anaerolineae bacterium]
MAAAALGILPERAFQLRVGNVSISELTLYDDVTLLTRWNDTHHLRDRGAIRPLALAIFLHQNHILVAKFTDPHTGQTFYRPLGGGIEFGETAAQALRREIREELAAEIEALEYAATLENIFIYNGQRGHEIVQLYRARFSDPRWYDLQKELSAAEEGVQLVWMPLAAFGKATDDPLYPDGLLGLLSE